MLIGLLILVGMAFYSDVRGSRGPISFRVGIPAIFTGVGLIFAGGLHLSVQTKADKEKTSERMLEVQKMLVQELLSGQDIQLRSGNLYPEMMATMARDAGFDGDTVRKLSDPTRYTIHFNTNDASSNQVLMFDLDGQNPPALKSLPPTDRRKKRLVEHSKSY